WLEGFAGIPCSVEIASEYRYRRSVPSAKALVVVISQSGETADTLAALHHAVSLGQPHTLAICNVPGSALMRAAQLRFLTRAGPEIGVASTKAFSAQLSALLLLALALGRARKRIEPSDERSLVQGLHELPAALGGALRAEAQIRAWAEKFAGCEHALF